MSISIGPDIVVGRRGIRLSSGGAPCVPVYEDSVMAPGLPAANASHVYDSGVSDGVFAVTIDTLPPTTAVRLYFRRVDASNEWFLNVNATTVSMSKRLAGSFVASGFTSFSSAAGMRLALRLEGTSIAVYADGVHKGTVTSSDMQAGTLAGPFYLNNEGLMSNYKVWSLACAAQEGL